MKVLVLGDFTSAPCGIREIELSTFSQTRTGRVLVDIERFFAKVSPEPNSGCWLWEGVLNCWGYGQFSINSHPYAAHRFAYALFIGPIPIGYDLDHRCRTRACCNPSHVRPVTKRENNVLNSLSPAAVNAQKIVCKRGHVLADQNLRTKQSRNSTLRVCRTCTKEDAARRHRLFLSVHPPQHRDKHWQGTKRNNGCTHCARFLAEVRCAS